MDNFNQNFLQNKLRIEIINPKGNQMNKNGMN